MRLPISDPHGMEFEAGPSKPLLRQRLFHQADRGRESPPPANENAADRHLPDTLYLHNPGDFDWACQIAGAATT